MKQVIEKRNATNQETHLLLVDLTKAYDSLPISKLWEVVGESNINNSLINLLTPNVNYSYSGRTAPLTSKVAFYIFIQQI